MWCTDVSSGEAHLAVGVRSKPHSAVKFLYPIPKIQRFSHSIPTLDFSGVRYGTMQAGPTTCTRQMRPTVSLTHLLAPSATPTHTLALRSSHRLPSSLSLWSSPLASLAAPSRTHTHAYHSRIPLTPHNHHPRSPPHTTPPQSRTEFLSLSGLRVDGRRPPEPRKVRCAFGVLPVADGSACFEQGNTKVLVTVRGPREVRRRADALHDRAILDCSFSLAPFAKVRHAKKRYTDRNALETQIAIKQVG